MRKMEGEIEAYHERYEQNEAETAQVKEDMQSILSYKNELEVLVEEQSQNISMSGKRLGGLEESLRYKDEELENKEGVLRRLNESSAETKKKLLQAEVKIRQLTQATVKDLKIKVKQKQDEIDVLKEMVKSSSNSLKAKDQDISRMNKRIQRLEKLVEINKQLDGAAGGRASRGNGTIPERDELLEET